MKTQLCRTVISTIALISCFGLFGNWSGLLAQQRITVELAGADQLAADAAVEIKLNRPLSSTDGRLAMVLDQMDITPYFLDRQSAFTYTPGLFPLAPGGHELDVYLVDGSENWRLVKHIKFKVARRKDPEQAAASESKTKWEFTPNLTLNLKGENNILFFPETSRPERLEFADTAGQGGFELGVKHAEWSFKTRFDFAGTSRQNEALRFGELGNQASRVDLSSYVAEVEHGRFKLQLGHVSFGSQRHLISGFSSRGIVLTLPAGPQNEIILTALNGSSIVGFSNFLGVTRKKHYVLGATFAREFIKERPGGLRVEFTAMKGSLLPVTGFNQQSVTDAERSTGGTIRVQFKDKRERLRFDGAFTRSQFTNPADPNLSQGFELTPVRPVTRNARYLEVSYDFLQGLTVWDDRKLKLSGTFRHEEIAPLFKSVVALSQADKRQNQFEVSASFGEINFVAGNLRSRDNLRGVPSILETLDRRNNVSLSVPLNTLFEPGKPKNWLPRTSYTYDHFHQFGAFFPLNGDFRDPSQIPDQHSFVHSFNADWNIAKYRFGYRFNRSFQDNRQPGRDRADFVGVVNTASFGTNITEKIDLNFELNHERATSLERPQTNKTVRIGTNMTWRDVFFKNLTLNWNASTTIAGDRENTNDSRNIDFDAQLAYQFQIGKEKFRKFGAQIFVRYANRYGSRIDRIFFLNNFNKTQAFNMGISFNFF
jgi:hypothetical protein